MAIITISYQMHIFFEADKNIIIITIIIVIIVILIIIQNICCHLMSAMSWQYTSEKFFLNIEIYF